MASKYPDSNGLLYVLTLLKNYITGGYVAKETGKGLSTNDYDATEKNKTSTAYTHSQAAHAPSGAEKNVIIGIQKNGSDLMPDASRKINVTVPTITNDLTTELKANYDEAYTHSQAVHAPSEADANVQADWGVDDTASDAYIKNKPSIPTVPTISTNITTDSGSDVKTASPKAVKDYVDATVSATYKPAGSVVFASLPALAASVVGNVYNVTNAFTTSADFVEGPGKSYPAGSNVVVIEATSGVYNFDVLGGFVDLSGYLHSADMTPMTNAEIDATFAGVFG